MTTSRFTLKDYSPEDEEKFIEMALDELSIRFMDGMTGESREERKLFKKMTSLF